MHGAYRKPVLDAGFGQQDWLSAQASTILLGVVRLAVTCRFAASPVGMSTILSSFLLYGKTVTTPPLEMIVAPEGVTLAP
jgi:hypothetical protein